MHQSAKVDENRNLTNITKIQSNDMNNSQLLQIIRNMESMLGTVIYEVNISREYQQHFRQEMSDKIDRLITKQKDCIDSVANVTKDFSSGVSCCIEKLDQYKKTSQTDPCEKTGKALKHMETEFSGLKKCLNTRLNTMKTTLQTVETSCTGLRGTIELKSNEYRNGTEKLQSYSQQIYESVNEIRKETKRSQEIMMDIERSVATLSETEPFVRPIKNTTTSTESQIEKEDIVTVSIDAKESTDKDVEITYANIATDATNKPRNIEEINQKTQEKDISPITTEEVRSDKNQIDNGRSTNQRKPKVCLLGDSIVGQIHVPQLGKATQTYVQRLRAPKFQDIKKYTHEVKDAKLIIIHTGINNLRNKEDTELYIKEIVESISSLKEAASPDSKIIISKLAPVADEALNIESELLNVQTEKKTRESYSSNITFIDHSNLTRRGTIVKDFYKQDKLHLSDDGIRVFLDNLKREINTKIITNSNMKSPQMRIGTQTNKNDSSSSGRQFGNGGSWMY